MTSTDDKLREQGNTVATLQNALKDRDFKIEGLIADNASLEAKLAVATINASVDPESKSANNPDAAADDRLRDTQTKLPENTGTIAALRKTLAARDSEITELGADTTALRAQLVAANARIQSAGSGDAADKSEAIPTLVAPPAAAPADPAQQTVEAQLAIMMQRAARTQRELNSAAKEMKTLRAHITELETRCASLDALVQGKDATLAERARRIEDLQDQMLRIEARVDERNQQIENLKRMREDQPPPGYVPPRSNNNPIQYTTNPKPQ